MFALTDTFHPLDVNAVVANMPTIRASHGASTVSEEYAHVSTLDVINRMIEEGFALHHAQVARVRSEAKRGYEKHLLRFRRVDAPTTGEGVPEIVMVNGHSGDTSFGLFGGFIRFICSNGLVVGTVFGSIRVRHIGALTLDKVIDGSYRVMSDFDLISDRIEAYRAKQLSSDAIAAFEHDATRIRLGDAFDKREATNRLPVLNTARRVADTGSDLWSTFNRVQENVMSPQRGSRMRRLSGIGSSVKINRDLFDLADRYLEAA